MFLFRKTILDDLTEQQHQYYRKTGQLPTDVVLSKEELKEVIKESAPLFTWARKQPNFTDGFMVYGLVVHLDRKGNTQFSYDDVFN